MAGNSQGFKLKGLVNDCVWNFLSRMTGANIFVEVEASKCREASVVLIRMKYRNSDKHSFMKIGVTVRDETDLNILEKIFKGLENDWYYFRREDNSESSK